MLELKEVKEYLRVDIEEDDMLIQTLISAAVEYLKNATGKEYSDKEANYELEKIYLKLLIAYWYENRTPAGKVGENFCQMTRALLLQLKLR